MIISREHLNTSRSLTANFSQESLHIFDKINLNIFRFNPDRKTVKVNPKLLTLTGCHSQNNPIQSFHRPLYLSAGILFIGIFILLHHILSNQNSLLLNTATTFGVLTGLVQTLGFIRWVFLAPFLVNTYFDPSSSQATKDAVLVLQEGFNRYAGVAVSEH